MTQSEDRDHDVDLDSLFTEARAGAAEPSEGLMARIAEDAASLQSAPAVATIVRRSVFSRMVDAVGGWPALGGMAAATVAGVYIGFAQPEVFGIAPTSAEATDFDLTSYLPDDTLFFDEGLSG